MARKWTRLYFGKKHKGKTLPWVLFHDPDYFFWACEERVFENRQALREEAREVYRKSRSIRIPQKKEGERRVAEYYFNNRKGRFVNLEIVPDTLPLHEGATKVFRLPVIDLSVPRQAKPYDKLGNRILIKTVKYVLFGSSEYRMTEKMCENFFNDDSNFNLS